MINSVRTEMRENNKKQEENIKILEAAMNENFRVVFETQDSITRGLGRNLEVLAEEFLREFIKNEGVENPQVMRGYKFKMPGTTDEREVALSVSNPDILWKLQVS